MDQIYKRPDRSLDRFDHDPELSYTIPARLYFDPDTLEEEKRKIFWKSWTLVGHESEIQAPGAYMTVEICGQYVFVIRGMDSSVRAFFNVCQHRGHILLKGKGKIGELITCPYHAWAYGRDGGLKAAPYCEDVKGFVKADFSLPEVKAEIFCGFVFVNLDPKAEAMARLYAGAEQQIRHYCPGVDKLNRGRTIPFDIKGNWKNVGDNLLECYHCAPAHKAFCDLVDMSTYVVEPHENWSIQYGACRPSNIAYDFDAAREGEPFVTIFLWPSLAFAIVPGSDGLATFTFRPLAPELTHQEFTFYTPEAEMTDAENRMLDYFNDVLGPEDVSLVENVQLGLHSLGYHQGRFIIDSQRNHRSEHAVHHLHSMYMAAMGID